MIWLPFADYAFYFFFYLVKVNVQVLQFVVNVETEYGEVIVPDHIEVIA